MTRAPKRLDIEMEIAAPVVGNLSGPQDAAASAPTQGERQLRLAELKANRAARNQSADGHEGDTLDAFKGPGEIEAGRIDRRASMEAMRSRRSANREQTANDSSMLGATSDPLHEVADCGRKENQKGTRSA